jgi:glycerol-3-phosphate dehydrogenase
MLTADATQASEPGLNPDGLRGAALYFDAQVTFPERLALENAIGAREFGGTVITHARVEHIGKRSPDSVVLRVRDSLEGSCFDVTGRVAVIATGPWLDETMASHAEDRMIGGTKGSHIVVGPFDGAPRSAIYCEAPSDGRPFFVIPWNGLYLIGTTDERFGGDLEDVRADDDEVNYLLAEVNWLFPGAKLTPRSVLFSYAGVRPLQWSTDGTEASITRRHVVRRHDRPWERLISIAGGKLTTYREVAEQTTDTVLAILNIPDPGCRTVTHPLPGAVSSVSTSVSPVPSVSPTMLRRLKAIYGTRADQLLTIANDTSAMRKLGGSLGLEVEVAFAVQQEFAETIVDVLMRRTMLGLSPSLALDILEDLLAAAPRQLGWDDERIAIERDDYLRYTERMQPLAYEMFIDTHTHRIVADAVKRVESHE